MNLSAPLIKRPVATVLLTLGIAIFGGLLVSQLLTMFTTPVIYLAVDRFSPADRGAHRDRDEHVGPDRVDPEPIPGAPS